MRVYMNVGLCMRVYMNGAYVGMYMPTLWAPMYVGAYR